MKPKHRNLLLILFSVIMVDIGQLTLKYTLNSFGAITWSKELLISNFFMIFQTPLIWLAIFFMVGSAFTYLLALSKTSLSFAYPILSVGYIVVSVLSWYFFGEIMTITKVIGLIIIGLGVIMLSNT